MNHFRPHLRSLTVAIAAACFGTVAFAQTTPPVTSSGTIGRPVQHAVVAGHPGLHPVAPPRRERTTPSVDTSALVNPAFLKTSAGMQTQQDLLKQQVANAKLVQQLTKLQSAPATPAPTPTPAASNTSSGGASGGLIALPHRPARAVLSIVTVGQNAVASIRDGNTVISAKVGTRLPSGWVVRSITTNEVVVAKGRAVRHLSFGG